MKKIIILIILILSVNIANSTEYKRSEVNSFIYKYVNVDSQKIEKYVVYLDGNIVRPEYYRTLFELLSNSKSEQTIVFKINSFGGDAFSGFQIYSEIKATKSHTIADVSLACSAGAIIAFACVEIKINKFSVIMVHSISLGVQGKISHMKTRTDFFSNLNEFVLNNIFSKILTIEELTKVLNGEDVWIFGDELKKRLNTGHNK